MMTLFGTRTILDSKKRFVQEFSKDLSFFQMDLEHDGRILLSPKDDIDEHDRALEFLNITQSLNKNEVNYIISRDGRFHICCVQKRDNA
jgi:hypothetical protein